MIRKDFTTMFNDLLLECVSKPAPMLHLLKQLRAQLMEAEVNSKLGAGKRERTDSRSGYPPKEMEYSYGDCISACP